MKKIISVLALSLTSAVCLATPNLSQVRPSELVNGSEFLVHLNDTELLEKGQKTWQLLGPEQKVRCEISIHSHYDQNLARQLGDVIYTIQQNNPQSAVDFNRNVADDQFALWLTTENKDLPLMLLNCHVETALSSKLEKHFTLGNVAKFIQQPGFFQKVMVSKVPFATAAMILPVGAQAVTQVPLKFKAVETSPGRFSLHNPNVQNGRLVEKIEANSPYCNIDYRGPGNDEKAYELVLESHTPLFIRYLTETRGDFYILEIVSPEKNISLNLSCFSRGVPFSKFSQFQAMLNSVIDFKAVAR